MTNLTIAVEEELLRQARIRALQQGTSVNAYLRDQLELLAGGKSQQQGAVRSLMARADRLQVGSGPVGRTWTREELYERPPHEPPPGRAHGE